MRYDVTIADRAPVALRGPVRAAALDGGHRCAVPHPAAHGREPLVAVFPLDLTDGFEVTVGAPGAEPDVVRSR
ncbi:hypothetical protein [Pseudonocardia abyssalis]|uniref:Uncharacterized protein n=1 Tax=Pseudonocardia abyssalis TaxID=2792008 RepID=A0ABS6UMY9_9PSEU|nr:hypothetical protein [Pseudonocardia abyssalis]MBW0116416.1 hypothetical protein [Pseudonocardia abyssalis]MBW0133316.1 hypothetical protein [Pseudonocardia abyssalis]